MDYGPSFVDSDYDHALRGPRVSTRRQSKTTRRKYRHNDGLEDAVETRVAQSSSRREES